MKSTLSVALSLALGASAFSASASTADLTVTGTIEPTSCAITLAAQGVISYGAVHKDELEADAANMLDEQTIATSVVCGAPVRFGLRVIGKRNGGVNTMARNALGVAFDRQVFSFGADAGDRPIGAYTLRFADTAMGDSNDVHTRITTDRDPSGNDWSDNEHMFSALPGNRVSGSTVAWAATAGGLPIALQEVTADLVIAGAIAPTDQLDLADDVSLDGHATLEVIYL